VVRHWDRAQRLAHERRRRELFAAGEDRPRIARKARGKIQSLKFIAATSINSEGNRTLPAARKMVTPNPLVRPSVMCGARKTSPRKYGSNQITFVQHDTQFAEAGAEDAIEGRQSVNNGDDDIARSYSGWSLNRTADFGDVSLGDGFAIHHEHRDRPSIAAEPGVDVPQDHYLLNLRVDLVEQERRRSGFSNATFGDGNTCISFVIRHKFFLFG
jgi:hypothetical protein